MPDFRMQPSFPVASVIDAAGRNAKLQQEARENGNQSLIAGLQSIGQVAQSLYDQKKRVAQSLALGKHLGVDENLARVMEPEQIISAAKAQKGYEDQNNYLQMLRKLTQPAQPTQDANPMTPTANPSPAAPAGPVHISPDHQAGAILASQISGAPVSDPTMGGGGLTPPTTGQVPVPIEAPSINPGPRKMISPAMQRLLAKHVESITPKAVYQYTPDGGLEKVGEKLPGEQVITAQPKTPANVDDPKYQAGLEKTYIGLKSRALSNRSGGLGLENNKVDMGIHLRKMLNTAYDAKTGEYTIPPSMHTEMALGMARMLSANGVVPITLEEQIRQATGREKIAAALIYFGADPEKVGGTTQSVTKYFVHQLDRQAQTAEENRAGYMDFIHGQAPVDLKPETIAKHDKIGLNSYTSLLEKSPDKTREMDQHGQAIQWAQEHPNDPRSAAILDKAMKATQGAGAQIGL